jgi:NAD-dependent deacetylase
MKKNIVILTGAGISAESGLKTFRDNNGLWENHRVEDVATPEAFARDPELVHRFYNLRRLQLNEVEPNAAHKALAELEQA